MIEHPIGSWTRERWIRLLVLDRGGAVAQRLGVKQMGITTHAARYSVDLVVVDERARFFTGDGSKREDYASFGHTVIAPGDGSVVAAYDDAPNESAPLTRTSYAHDPLQAIYGNYIVIDHGRGEAATLL